MPSASAGLDERGAPCVDAVEAMPPTKAKISARIFYLPKGPQRATFRDGG